MHEPLPRRTAVQIDVAVTHVLGRDIETRSTISLKKVGAHNYAADPALERVNRKDAAGERLMHAMSKPRKPRDRLPPLLAAEQMLSALSNRINERGFHVDCAFAQAARRIAQEAALAITRLRLKRGLPEFDDGLPAEPDAPFRMIRSIILTPFPSHSAGAHRGEARLDHTPFHQHEETRHD
jgi:hypothetical protein